MSDAEGVGAPIRRLAIIGAGSSGLITLKHAIDHLPGWQVVCFEASDRVVGVWGNPYRGFVSTSTRYTTQFCCYPERDATVEADGGRSRAEFFRDGQFGEYLNRFADSFDLRKHLTFGHQVVAVARADRGGWDVTVRPTRADAGGHVEYFEAVVICTGLTAQTKPIETTIPTLALRDLNADDGTCGIRGERIVVFGGGESGVDHAARLADPALGNTVFLSLRTGIRVSPRYHPIHGVPSDFLRNRLLLSIHPDLRNRIGQRFVEARMLHQEWFERWFPAAADAVHDEEPSVAAARQAWAYRLTKGAKDDLFNMFHNKSDDFLSCVARGQITIVGPPVDSHMQRFRSFDSSEEIDVRPTKVFPAVGYRSTLTAIGGESLCVRDFYLGCVHARHPGLYLVGFARPVIGNIPSISEVQAAFVVSLIGGRISRPHDIADRHVALQRQNDRRFATLDRDIIYPVEMFPYCDELARQMDRYPSLRRFASIGEWWRAQVAPATTAFYWNDNPHIRRFFARAPIYMPRVLIALLLLLKPVDGAYRLLQWCRHPRAAL
jgi:dimethylaniline monooxygenase (N-oxide forming)